MLGLISAWGTVAIHGREGFRAERAAVRCLFTDWARSAPVPGVMDTWLTKWWRRTVGRLQEPDGAGRPDPGRTTELEAAARRYGVPLLPLKGALVMQVLGEWGVPPEQIQEVETWVAANGARTQGG